MEVNRAQQILSTDDKIPVQLNGTPVWIDSVDAKEQTATVHNENNPADTRTVKLRELQEVH
jgi:small acid-soluble spore protein H (minor)